VDEQVDEQEWRKRNAARLRRALERPEVRAELLALLGMGDDGRQRARRLDAARVELAGLELRWTLGEDEDAWEA
jgi:phosphoglycerate dehydrogenase-like enzyme